MKTFDFSVAVDVVEGTQTIRVEAENEKAALAKLKAKGGDIISTDLEVQSLNYNDVTLLSEEEVP